jgi:hypothetical protein
VSGAVPITGVRTGVQRPDQNLWIFIHPQDGSTKRWAHPDYCLSSGMPFSFHGSSVDGAAIEPPQCVVRREARSC